MPSENGSGEAIHSWNNDQASATPMMIFATMPLGRRPPVSDSATICRISSSVISGVFNSLSLTARPPSGQNNADERRPRHGAVFSSGQCQIMPPAYIQPFSL